MPAEHRYIDGTLRQGYFCSNCGQSCNMLGTGHNVERKDRSFLIRWTCESNPKLVEKLRKANPPPGFKPHYTISPNTFKHPRI